jgi:hypothetical protein
VNPSVLRADEQLIRRHVSSRLPSASHHFGVTPFRHHTIEVFNDSTEV